MSERQYWVIKSEPSVYPFAQLQKECKTAWTGIRNFEARNNLRKMEPGDLALYYHTGEGKEIVGVARVLSSATADPTAPKEDWASVDVEAVAAPPSFLSSPAAMSSTQKSPRDFCRQTRLPFVKINSLDSSSENVYASIDSGDPSPGGMKRCAGRTAPRR